MVWPRVWYEAAKALNQVRDFMFQTWEMEIGDNGLITWMGAMWIIFRANGSAITFKEIVELDVSRRFWQPLTILEHREFVERKGAPREIWESGHFVRTVTFIWERMGAVEGKLKLYCDQMRFWDEYGLRYNFERPGSPL